MNGVFDLAHEVLNGSMESSWEDIAGEQ